MSRNDKWTREQLIMALNVYCKIPFKDVKEWHPIIKKYAPLIGRSPVALKMKVGNFGRFDPNLRSQGIVGLGHGSKDEEVIWNEFWGNPEKLAFESERLFAERAKTPIEKFVEIDIPGIPKGKNRDVIIHQRVNQCFFRKMILCAYLNRCCVTGITHTSLLEACHILSWSDDEVNRMNPSNGLCMNPLFHKAYDKYLMTITPDYEICISDRMLADIKEDGTLLFLKNLSGKHIIMPEKFFPNQDFLSQHYEEYRQRN